MEPPLPDSHPAGNQGRLPNPETTRLKTGILDRTHGAEGGPEPWVREDPVRARTRGAR